MAPGCSLEALQWLTYMQEHESRFLNSKGERMQMQHKYFRGEHRIGDWEVDGYCEVDGHRYFLEYLGCFFHAGCSNIDCDQFDPHGVDENFSRKKEFLEANGTLISIRGCEWKKKLRTLRSLPSPSFPDVYQNFSSEQKILNGIENSDLFGFIVADVSTPDEVLEKILPLNFPPIIHRAEIDESMVSDYMKNRCNARDRKLPQETLVQTYHAKQLMMYTPTAKFYLQLGLKISNVSKFIQFIPTQPLESFVEKITQGRINAVKSGNDSLGTAYKIIGNS